MKKHLLLSILALSLAVLSGCGGQSTDTIAEIVKRGLQEQLEKNPSLKDEYLVVSDVAVVKEQGNRYRGIATIVFEGEAREIPIGITADGENVMFEVAPGAFLFIAEKRLQEMGASPY